MPLYRQDPETLELRLIENASSVRKGDIFVRGDIDPFVSPIDGSTIRNRKDYEEHCKKHNVVPAQEFSPEFMARKRKERERLYKGEHTAKETFARKQEIYEAIVRAERNDS